MRAFLVIGSALVLLTSASPASADDSGSVQLNPVSYKVTAWPQEIETCFEHCENVGIIAPRRGTASSDDAEARRRASEAKRQAKGAQTTARAGLAGLGKLRGEIAALDRQLNALKGEVGLLKSGRSSDRAELEQRIEQLKTAIAERLSLIEMRLTRLENRPEASGYATAQNQLETMSTETDSLQRLAERAVRLGPEAGFLLVNASSSGHVTLYTGMPIGATMSLGLSDSWSLVLGADILLAKAEQPFGSQVRGLVRHRFEHGITFGVGLSGSFVGFDRRLDAAAAYLMTEGEAGFQYKSFRLGLGFLSGLGLHHDFGPGFAYGGIVRVGAEF